MLQQPAYNPTVRALASFEGVFSILFFKIDLLIQLGGGAGVVLGGLLAEAGSQRHHQGLQKAMVPPLGPPCHCYHRNACTRPPPPRRTCVCWCTYLHWHRGGGCRFVLVDGRLTYSRSPYSPVRTLHPPRRSALRSPHRATGVCIHAGWLTRVRRTKCITARSWAT
jgi:hypothetical protein